MWLIFKLMYYNSCNCGTQVPLTFYFTTLLCWKLFFFSFTSQSSAVLLGLLEDKALSSVRLT